MSENNFHITTPRLYLSRQNPSNDAQCDFAVSLLSSPSSIKYNPSGPSIVPNRDAARSFIEAGTERLLRTGHGRYLVSLRPSTEDNNTPFSEPSTNLIGVVTMQLHRYPATPGPLIPDIGFNFLPKYHGKGYAREAAEGLMKYFREERGIKAFAALTDDENVEAKGLLRKLGFREWGVRGVKGVINGGKEEDLSVWTRGVEEGELDNLGL